MSKLNTDTNKKEFWKKFGMSGWQHKVWNSTDEIWNWIDQVLQQAYRKGYMEGWKDEVFLKSELKKK